MASFRLNLSVESRLAFLRCTNLNRYRIGSDALKDEIRSLHAQIHLHSDACALQAIIDFAHLACVFQDESNMKIRRINGCWGTKRIADGEPKSCFVLKESDLLLALVRTTHSAKLFKGAAGRSDTWRSICLSLIANLCVPWLDAMGSIPSRNMRCSSL